MYTEFVKKERKKRERGREIEKRRTQEGGEAIGRGIGLLKERRKREGAEEVKRISEGIRPKRRPRSFE